MISEGLRLMAVGMFTVFAFLALLVGLMRASALFFEKYAERFPEEESGNTVVTRLGNDAEVALALAIAEAYRRGQRV